LLHGLATRVAHAVLRRRSRRAAPERPGGEQVSILLMHAWGLGGTIRTMLNLGGHLAERHEVEILSIVRLRDDPFFALPPGVTITAVDDQRPRPGSGARALGRRLLRALPSLLMFPGDRASRACTLWSDLQVVRVLWRIRSGVLIGTRPSLNLLAIEAACPGLTVLGMEHMHYSAHSALSRERIRRRYPKLDGVVVLTEHDLREYGRVLDGSTRLVRIPNAVPERSGAISELTNPIVVAAGRLSYQKGFDRLIGAFAKVAVLHPDWTLRIFGRGPRRKALQRLIDKHRLADNVVLMGADPTLDEQMANASLFVLSSRFEGLPMVMLEAMSKGLPIVSFDCPTGPGEVIDHGRDGILVPDGDADGLAAAMIELIGDADKRRRYGAAAADAATGFSLDRVGARWETLFESLKGPLDQAPSRVRIPARP
jgi:glycosyltransferase involved in cell wall biosynthesis